MRCVVSVVVVMVVVVVVVVECQNKSNIGEQERRRGQQPTV